MSSKMQEQDHSRSSSAADHSSSSGKDAAAAGPCRSTSSRRPLQQKMQMSQPSEVAAAACVGSGPTDLRGNTTCLYRDPLAWQATADMELSRCSMVVQ